MKKSILLLILVALTATSCTAIDSGSVGIRFKKRAASESGQGGGSVPFINLNSK